MIRALSVFAVVLSALIGPAWIFFVAAGLFSIRYCGYEVIVIAALLDAYFGLGGIPYYLITTFIGVLVLEWSKPKVTLYTA
jgi:hypothetical protein